MDVEYSRRVLTSIILISLLVLAFFVLKPILISIIVGVILAFVFAPVYKFLLRLTNSKNVSATIMCTIFLLIIILPIWFLTPIFIEQSFKIYQASQQIDFIQPLKTFFPNFFASEEFSLEVASILRSSVTRTANYLVNSFSDLILNFPTMSLQFLVVLFTFYFVLRDEDILLNYIKSILPFSKEVERKIFTYSKDITKSVIYGQVLIGILQGLILGVGLFVFNVPNALFLTLLACLAGILPIVGTAVIWIPVTVYLVIAGNNAPAVGIVVFGIVSSSVDNLLRPIFVSRMTSLPSSVVLIGMIGGLFLFGVVGFILGPLILAYLLILLELYRNQKAPGIFIPPGQTT